MLMEQPKHPSREAEHRGSIFKHPYMIYILLTVLLFTFLIIMTLIAKSQGWIPDRGLAPQ